MIISIDRSSSVTVSQQIVDQIRGLVAAGTLRAGYQLPPIRQLAKDLSAAPGTVARAYRDLELVGITESRGRHGTVISEGASVNQDEELADIARDFARRIGILGVSTAEALRQARQALGN